MFAMLALGSLEAVGEGEQPKRYLEPPKKYLSSAEIDAAAARYVHMVNMLAPEEGEIKTMRGSVLPAWKWEIVLRVFTGFDISVGSCQQIKVGPLPEQEYSGKTAWLKLIETRCPVKDFPRELLAVNDVWIHLSGLCSTPSISRSAMSFRDPVARRAIKKGIPRACGLLTIVDYRPTAELPRVMHIVPWKKSQLGGDLPRYEPDALLDDVLTPLDRDVFRREVSYYHAVAGEAVGPDN